MFRIKLSWLLGLLAFLAWSIVLFQLSAFAADDVIWQAQVKPYQANPSWGTLSGCPEVIEMKPTMLAPKNVPATTLKPLLSRLVGRALGSAAPKVGIVYSILDLENRRQAVAYALQQLQKDGVEITPETLQKWMAEDHGINTNATTPAGTFIDGKLYANNYLWVASLSGTVNRAYNQGDILYNTWMTSMPSPGSVYQIDIYTGNAGLYSAYSISGYTPYTPTSFDPANYPEIFGPEYFPSQAIDALMARDLDSFDLQMAKDAGPLDDHVFVDVDSGNPTSDSNYWELLSQGLKYIAPIIALGDAILSRFNTDGLKIDVQTDKGTTTLSADDAAKLNQNGVPDGATILRVDPSTGSVTYMKVEGWPETTTIPKEDATKLTNSYPVYNTFNNSTKTTNIHQEISLPEVHVSGELKTSNATLQPVAQERVDAAKARFQESWQNLKQTFAEMFSITLTGVGRLPTWTWVMLGQTIVIDFNEYAIELNWLSLAFLFLATISAVFIVINH